MLLKDRKSELGILRVAQVTGGAPNKLAKMCALAHCALNDTSAACR